MFTIMCYYYHNGRATGIEGAPQYASKLKDAIKICKNNAKEYKRINEGIKLLEYERMHKSERLVYGVYCMSDKAITKEFRIYEK